MVKVVGDGLLVLHGLLQLRLESLTELLLLLFGLFSTLLRLGQLGFQILQLAQNSLVIISLLLKLLLKGANLILEV